jgi:hypothetical protein
LISDGNEGPQAATGAPEDGLLEIRQVLGA